MEEKKFFSLVQASRMLGIKVRTAREWVRRGKLKGIKYPGCRWWFVPAEEIDRLMEAANADED